MTDLYLSAAAVTDIRGPEPYASLFKMLMGKVFPGAMGVLPVYATYHAAKDAGDGKEPITVEQFGTYGATA